MSSAQGASERAQQSGGATLTSEELATDAAAADADFKTYSILDKSLLHIQAHEP